MFNKIKNLYTKLKVNLATTALSFSLARFFNIFNEWFKPNKKNNTSQESEINNLIENDEIHNSEKYTFLTESEELKDNNFLRIGESTVIARKDDKFYMLDAENIEKNNQVDSLDLISTKSLAVDIQNDLHNLIDGLDKQMSEKLFNKLYEGASCKGRDIKMILHEFVADKDQAAELSVEYQALLFEKLANESKHVAEEAKRTRQNTVYSEFPNTLSVAPTQEGHYIEMPVNLEVKESPYSGLPVFTNKNTTRFEKTPYGSIDVAPPSPELKLPNVTEARTQIGIQKSTMMVGA